MSPDAAVLDTGAVGAGALGAEAGAAVGAAVGTTAGVAAGAAAGDAGNSVPDGDAAGAVPDGEVSSVRLTIETTNENKPCAEQQQEAGEGWNTHTKRATKEPVQILVLVPTCRIMSAQCLQVPVPVYRWFVVDE